MKILSEEVVMQSQHSISKIELENKLSFSTFFVHPQSSSSEMQTNPLEKREVCSSDYFSDTMKTISEIIQNLLAMLREKREEIAVEDEQSGGFTHLSYRHRYEEHESLSFSTKGCVQTDKGFIDLNINFSMSRSFAIEHHIDIYSKLDPLVININGDIPDLSTDTFSFDLDNDGSCEQISKLKEGSGFLVLDKNEDGIINQGSELFGTQSGDGFGELRAYDRDANNWIDENDSIFDKLQIWLKDDEGSKKELVGLGEVGIGAIFLGSTQSEFRYKTQTNQTLGELKSCGLFLNEDGSCGNISQIDLASRKDAEPLAELLRA